MRNPLHASTGRSQFGARAEESCHRISPAGLPWRGLRYLGRIFRGRARYKQALASAVGLGDKKAEAHNLIGIARCLEQRNESARALEKIQLAVALHKATGGIPEEDEQLLGSLYLDLGAIDTVEPFILKTGSPALVGRLYLARRLRQSQGAGPNTSSDGPGRRCSR